MKKLEQSILLILIITCIGMCFGSVLIALQRSKEESNDRNQINQIFFRQNEEEKINLLLKNQLYPALMHSQSFPSSLFQNNSELLTTEEEKFYFVLEMLRTENPKKVVCTTDSSTSLIPQCRVLVSDFQASATRIFDRKINISLVQNSNVYQLGEYVYSDYIPNWENPSFVLRFSKLTELQGVYTLALDFYTSLVNDEVNYQDIHSWSSSGLISQRFLYGQILIQYRMVGENRVITTVSFSKV